MEKLKEIFLKHKKKIILGGVGVIVLIIGISILVNGPKDITNDVKPIFSGYDGRGHLVYNDKEIDNQIRAIVTKKMGYSVDDFFSNKNMKNSPKFQEFKYIMDNIHYDFDKKENLHNGDEVVFKITADVKNSPIKSSSKKFKVSGLKESEKITIDNLLEKNPIKVEGYNGFGTINIDEQFEFTKKMPSVLSNGDKIEIKVKQATIDSLEKEGKIVENDAATKEITVEGLKEITEISNLSDIVSKIDDVTKADLKGYESYGYAVTYSFEKQKSFISYNNGTNNFFSTKPNLTVYNLYKIVKTTTYNKDDWTHKDGETETKEYYTCYGYSHVEVYENKLIFADLASKIDKYFSNYDDLDSAVAKLKSDGFVEYTQN